MVEFKIWDTDLGKRGGMCEVSQNHRLYSSGPTEKLPCHCTKEKNPFRIYKQNSKNEALKKKKQDCIILIDKILWSQNYFKMKFQHNLPDY